VLFETSDAGIVICELHQDSVEFAIHSFEMNVHLGPKHVSRVVDPAIEFA